MKPTVYRLCIERKKGFENEARRTLSDLVNFVGITHIESLRYLNRYDIQGITENMLKTAATHIFSEPQSDIVYFETFPLCENETVIAIEYVPGQYDQRSDSATQCLALLKSPADQEEIIVRCARLFVLQGSLSPEDIEKARDYLINPVDSREATHTKPLDLTMITGEPSPITIIEGFTQLNEKQLEKFHANSGLAMDLADITFLQNYFVKQGRNPTETELKVLDTYWSDHCRHTTFNTVLENIEIEESPLTEPIKTALSVYSGLRTELYVNKSKELTLMDMATIGARALKKRGLLADIEESAEINACSIYIDVKITDDSGSVTSTEPWLLMFKNETHNHPTEIEPFGGAATCIGGAIRDPLSGRAWVYQALRVTGAGDPTRPITETIPGKLPQIKLTREAAAGFSAYGNQIGLTTGQVVEYYDAGFLAKRMELGAVIAATPVSSVVREEPEDGDLIIMVGGGTGRDGIGGATGSSKVHTSESVTTAGAEVQKGNAVEERKIQRLFRDPNVTRLIRRCNDFGAGGVAVAVGELAPGLDIDLDSVPKKYEGLNGTELAISESQERMAVVVKKADAEAFIAAAQKENLNAAIIAKVTSNNRLVMKWKGKTIVDIEREFLDTAGATRSAKAYISAPSKPWDWNNSGKDASLEKRWKTNLASLAVASQRGLSERFDGSIGSSSILFPMGGAYQSTPECGMAARIPVGPNKETTTASLMTMGYDPTAASWSPFHGAQYAVLESLTKILCLGGDPSSARLTFQEYFEKTSTEQAWGKPAAALLGALSAQLAAGTASIGGKDSMSGTFHDLSVPPTLVSFAVAVTDSSNIIGGAFSAPGNHIVLVSTPWLADNTPHWDAFLNQSRAISALRKTGSIRAAYPISRGGIAASLSKMCFGNRIGIELDTDATNSISLPLVFGTKGEHNVLFAPLYGTLLLEIDGTENLPPHTGWTLIGKTISEPVIIAGSIKIPLDQSQMTWEKTLAPVFPPVSGIIPAGTMPTWASVNSPYLESQFLNRRTKKAANRSQKPLVVLPVFPGTNCEYDMARAFRLSGAEPRIIVLRNRTPKDLEESLMELRNAIDASHILAFSGGFSAGDEPDGSGKFIANIIRENRIADGIMDLLDTRKGLILGICNGFQALIKVGLVPYGKILSPSEDMPTLTYNTIGRHVSRFVRTRITSDATPWANGENLLHGKIHTIPLSHGEGRVIIDDSLAQDLFKNGQIFSQYVDKSGVPVMTEPDNPNGSMFAIEGMTDPSGRVLGKMGHSERPLGTASGPLFSNIPGDTCQNIFTAGVAYWQN